MSLNPRPCERCGNLIPLERLEALPETRVCVRCSQTIGGEFVVSIVPENLAKTGSLKKNYGGYTVQKRRKRIQRMDQ